MAFYQLLTSHWVQVAVGGLKGLEYFDNVTQSEDYKSELDEAVRISGETDRIYRQAPNTITVSNLAELPQSCNVKDALCILQLTEDGICFD